MVTLSKYGAKYNRNILFLEGLSTDTKPTGEFDGLSIQNGSEYTEVDTGKKFLFDYDNAIWYEVQTGGGGGGGTSNYNELSNRPQINSTTLTGNKTSSDLGLQSTIDSSHKLSADLIDDTSATNKFNVQADWNQTTDTASDYIKNKPTIPAAQVNSDWNASSGVSQILNKPTLGTAAAAATTDFATSAQGTKADSAVQSVKVNGSALTPDANKAVDITAIPASIVSAGALASGMTATTQSNSDDSTKLATTAFVHDVVDALPEPMVFTGSITLTANSIDTTKASITVSAPSSASSIVKGYTYKITSIASSPVYTGTLKVGDTLIAAQNSPDVTATWVADTDWTIVPSGDETGYVVGKASGTTQNNLVKWGADGYTVDDSGIAVETSFSGTSDAKVPTSKSIKTNVADNAVLTGFTAVVTPSSIQNVASTDTITDAMEKLDNNTRLNQTNILTVADSGGAKNLFRNTATSGSYRGVDYTVNADGTITTTGTTTQNYFKVVLGNFTFENGVQYVISGCPSGGGAQSYQITNSGDAFFTDFGNGYTLTGDGNQYEVVIYAPNTGTNMNGLTFKPMICTKAQWDISHTYQPYAMSISDITAWILSQT